MDGFHYCTFIILYIAQSMIIVLLKYGSTYLFLQLKINLIMSSNGCAFVLCLVLVRKGLLFVMICPTIPLLVDLKLVRQFLS